MVTLLSDLDEVMKDDHGATGIIRLPQGGTRIYINWPQGSFEFYAHTIDDLRDINIGIERLLEKGQL
jgi:hypothetical protein